MRVCGCWTSSRGLIKFHCCLSYNILWLWGVRHPSTYWPFWASLMSSSLAYACVHFRAKSHQDASNIVSLEPPDFMRQCQSLANERGPCTSYPRGGGPLESPFRRKNNFIFLLNQMVARVVLAFATACLYPMWKLRFGTCKDGARSPRWYTFKVLQVLFSCFSSWLVCGWVRNNEQTPSRHVFGKRLDYVFRFY